MHAGSHTLRKKASVHEFTYRHQADIDSDTEKQPKELCVDQIECEMKPRAISSLRVARADLKQLSC